MLRRASALLALPLACMGVAGCAGLAAGASGRPQAHSTQHQASAADQGTNGLKTVTIEVGGRTRTYLLYVPPGDTSAHPLPLVLVFHGAGDTAAHTVDETDLPNIARQDRSMILVFPQGHDNSWNEGTGGTPAAQARVDDVRFVAAILRRVERGYAVDRHRVIATGFSNGALLTEDLGCTLSRQLTMIAPVEGQLPQAISSRCHPPLPVTVFEVHGTADTTIPYGGGGFTGVGGTPGPTVLSAPESAQRWATLDGCPGQAASRTSDSVTFATYGGCEDHVTVTLATVHGGQHQWPSGYGPTLAGAIASMSTNRIAIP